MGKAQKTYVPHDVMSKVLKLKSRTSSKESFAKNKAKLEGADGGILGWMNNLHAGQIAARKRHGLPGPPEHSGSEAYREIVRKSKKKIAKANNNNAHSSKNSVFY